MSNVFRPRKIDLEGGDLKHVSNFPEKLSDLEYLFSQMTSRGDHPLSKSSVSNYVRKINRLAILVTGSGYNGNLDWINNSKNVIDKLTHSKLSSKKDYITPIIRLLKHYNSSNDTIAEYQKALSAFKGDEDKERKDNKASAKEKSLAYPLQDIKRKILEFKPQNDAELVQKVIVSFYFLNDAFTPRNDLYEMKIVSNTKKPNKMDDRYNYLVVNKEGKSEGIIMNNYKTAHTYGRQRFTLSPELRQVLDQYLKEYKKQPGDFLFVMRDGQPFKESNFRNLIESSMEYIIGTPINIGLARKIKITNYYSGKAHTINEDEEFARSFLHSTGVQKEYLKVDLYDKDD